MHRWSTYSAETWRSLILCPIPEQRCTKCTVHCEKPLCSVRCPKQMCERKSCPPCETICAPAQCHTTCDPPKPVCRPVCQDTMCKWKCRRPSTCPKRTCELKCKQVHCPDLEKKKQCCNCDNREAVLEAMQRAGVGKKKGVLPTFLETMSTMLHEHQQGRDSCCPCNKLFLSDG